MPAPAAPLQARSRRTEAALLRAGRALIARRGYDAVSVPEIARKAGVSVGGFYARFPGKAELFARLYRDTLTEGRAAIEKALAARGLTIGQLVRRYVRVMVDMFVEHQAVIRAGRTAGVPDLTADRMAFNRSVHAVLVARLLEQRHRISRKDADRAARFGLFLVSAGAREAVLAGALSVYDLDLSPAALIDELTAAYLAYLGVED